MEGTLLTKSEHNVTIYGDSSSTDGQTQHEAEGVQWCDPCANVWNSTEFVVTLAQIVAAILVLTLSKDDQDPQEMFLTFIIGYTCACIATLPVLCWRFLQSNGRFSSESGINQGMDKFKRMLEFLIVIWVVMLIWQLIFSPALDYSSPHLWLCVAFLGISCIRDVYPNLPYAVIYILFTLLGHLIQLLDIDFDIKMTFYIGIVVCIIGIVACIRNRCTSSPS